MMRLQRHLAIGLSVALAACCAASAAGPVPTEIKKQYWQFLPGIRRAYADHLGNVWLTTREKCSVEKSYRSKLKLMPDGWLFLLGDSRGRVWFSQALAAALTNCYDGKQWTKLDFRAVKGFEDSAGRVFLIGPTHFHVLEKDKWTKLKHADSPPRHQNWRIRQDTRGRVWFWVHQSTPPGRPLGAWCFSDGKWTHHTAKTGFPTDLVHAIVPMSGGRSLVILDDYYARPNFVVWSSPEAGDKKVPTTDRHDFLPDYSGRHLRFEGIDDDGNSFVRVEGLTKSHRATGGDRTAIVYFTPKGDGRLLTVGRAHSILARIPRNWRQARLYVSLKDKRAWDGKKLKALAIWQQKVFCRDRLGRIYFRGTGPTGVHVIWPAQERPGDVIRADRHDGMDYGQAFQDRAGQIWFNSACLFSPGGRGGRRGGELLRWDGKGWQVTPVRRRASPKWWKAPGSRPSTRPVVSPSVRLAPSWVILPDELHTVEGKGGMLLALTVRNAYQIGSPRPAPPVQFHRPPPKDASWLEGWLWRDGKWTPATKIQELIRKQFDSFVKGFTVQTPEAGFFDLQSDGKHVWAAYNGKVYVFSRGGKVASWDMPKPKPKETWPPQWGLVNLICLGGGKIWCAHQGRRRVDVTTLALSKGKIQAELGRGGVTSSSSRTLRFYVTKDEWFWRWGLADEYGNAYDRAFLWKDRGWEAQEPFGAAFFEDRNGRLWFSHHNPPNQARGHRFFIVGRGGRIVLPWPRDLPTGVITRAGRNLRLAACGSYVVSIVPAGADKPDQWKAGRVHLLAGAVEYRGVFLDGKGGIVGASGWTGKFAAEAARAR